MEFTDKKVAASRRRLQAQAARIARQREMINQAASAHHPLDDLHARLLVMEQSLMAMKRYLRILERDLEQALGIHRPERPMRPRAKGPGRADES